MRANPDLSFPMAIFGDQDLQTTCYLVLRRYLAENVKLNWLRTIPSAVQAASAFLTTKNSVFHVEDLQCFS